MSFTEAGFKRVVAGEYASGFVTGRLGIQLVSIRSDSITVKYIIAAPDSNEAIYEYETLAMKVGQQVLLNGAELKIPFEVVPE